MTNPDELERLARAATPGPWSVHEQRPSASTSISGTFIHAGPDHADDTGFSLVARTYTRDGLEERERNAAFIAAANPATILSLLSANREMREALLNIDACSQHSYGFSDFSMRRRCGQIARSALTTQRGDGE